VPRHATNGERPFDTARQSSVDAAQLLDGALLSPSLVPFFVVGSRSWYLGSFVPAGSASTASRSLRQRNAPCSDERTARTSQSAATTSLVSLARRVRRTPIPLARSGSKRGSGSRESQASPTCHTRRARRKGVSFRRRWEEMLNGNGQAIGAAPHLRTRGARHPSPQLTTRARRSPGRAPPSAGRLQQEKEASGPRRPQNYSIDLRRDPASSVKRKTRPHVKESARVKATPNEKDAFRKGVLVKLPVKSRCPQRQLLICSER